MEGTSVLDQNKPKAGAPASVLDSKQPAASGEQSVLGGSAEHKPLTFYKKPWFWITIGVVIVGVGALIAFLVINANLTAEAIEKYTKNAVAANEAVSDYDREFRSAYSDAGLGYYSSDNKRFNELHDKCLKEKFEIEHDEYNDAKDLKYYNGEKAAEEIGTGETRKLSDSFAKIADKLDNIDEKIDQCKEILEDTLKNDYKLTIGDFKIEEGRYYSDYELPIKITNKSNYKIKFYVKIKAVSKDGTLLGNDYFYSDLLDPGESDDATLFDYGFSSKLDKMKEAKFEVVEVSERTVE